MRPTPHKFSWFFLVFLLTLSLACTFPGLSPQPKPAPTNTATRSLRSPTPAQPANTPSPGITRQPTTAVPALPSSPTPTITLTTAPGEPLWISNRFDRKVLKIDADSGKIIASIQLNESPIAAESRDNSVWVAAFKKIYRLNDQTGQISATIDLGSYTPVSLKTSESGVWVGVADISKDHLVPLGVGYCPPGGVIKIDPKTNTQVKFIDLKIPAFYLAADGNEVWVDNMECMGETHNLLQIHPTTYTITPYPNLSAAIDGEARGIHHFAGMLWSPSKLGENGAVFSLDPISQKADKKFTLPGLNGSSGIVLTSNRDSLWAFDRLSSKIYRIPPTGTEAELYLQPDAKSGVLEKVTATKQNLWLYFEEQARIVQGDIRTKQIVRELSAGMDRKAYSSVTNWQPCPAAYPSRLRVGDFATVTKDPPLPNRLRSDPNTSSTILGQVEAGGSVGIVDGPVCNNNWIWWKVRTSKANLGGWTAEGDEKTYWLVPTTP